MVEQVGSLLVVMAVAHRLHPPPLVQKDQEVEAAVAIPLEVLVLVLLVAMDVLFSHPLRRED